MEKGAPTARRSFASLAARMLAHPLSMLLACCWPPASNASESIRILVRDPPAGLTVGERYAFHTEVRNDTARPVRLSVEFTVRDGSVELDNVGIAKEIDAEVTIGRRPPLPRTGTDLLSTSTAVCGWGTLAPRARARCGFYVSAVGITLSKIPFGLVARDQASGRILASHILRYRIEAGEYLTHYLGLRSARARERCAEHAPGGEWTPAFAACFDGAERGLGPPAYPFTSKSFEAGGRSDSTAEPAPPR
jgi:hypothetical protein